MTFKLNPAHVKPPKDRGPKGDYIEGWHAMAEANRIFGFDGWSYEVPDVRCVSERPRDIGRDKKPGFGVSYIATVRVTVGDVTRVDVGSGHGYDVDCGLAHESAIKEAVTDALKRALRSFGNPFGLALYDQSRENVGIDAPPPPSKLDWFLGNIDRADSAVALGEWLSRPKVASILADLGEADQIPIDEAKTARIAELEKGA
jgi:DNA recombination protein Rad52